MSSTQRPHNHTASLRAEKTTTSSRHRRDQTVSSVPMPSHRPPSTFHSFRGNIKTQDIFMGQFKKFNEKLRVLFPGEDTFEMERMEMWNHDAICTPCLIVQPTSVKQVSSCLRGYTAGFLKCLSANRKHGLALPVPRLCVAGGRNSSNAMRDGSIVLDLSQMRHVSVDAKTQTCVAQGGARVIDLDSALANHGLIAVSGANQNLGVVGCILGGGLGYASRKYGLACDNLLYAEVILSDGRLKQCSPNKHQDLFWSICGGGGGMGVIVSVTLRCFPLRHAASLTYELQASSFDRFQNVIRRWANWIEGDAENDQQESDSILKVNEGAPREVYSHLILHANSTNINFLGTSIDTDVILQSEGLLDGLKNTSFKKKKRNPLSIFHGNSDKNCPTQWDDIPGLVDLIENKFGATNRCQERFNILRYDQFQAYSDQYQKPGHVIHATKFANSLTNRIIQILTQATIGDKSRKNDSRITIMSAGGVVNDIDGDNAAFDARSMKYFIFIEGRWDTDTRIREQKEKQKTRIWMNWIVKQLHLCNGVRSTAYPEWNRGRKSQTDVNDPPLGSHNFGEKNGKRLMEIKEKRDPRRVFSHASRVSWSHCEEETSSATEQAASVPADSNLTRVGMLKDGEVNSSACLIPPARIISPSDTSSSIGDVEILSISGSKHDSNELNVVDEQCKLDSEIKSESKDDENINDFHRLLSIGSSDDDIKDWSLPIESDAIYDEEDNELVC